MKATVIIPTFRRPAFLSDAVASVLKQDASGVVYDVLVVDNAPEPTPSLVDFCYSLRPHPVRYVHEPRNGLHNARHAGARAAAGEVLVYIDDDVLCPPGWLAGLLNPFAEPCVGAVGGQVRLRYESAPPKWIERFTYLLSEFDLGNAPRAIPPLDSVVGCNMAVRRSLLFQVGGFNPDAFGDRRLIHHRGDGECGLTRKIHEAGSRIMYEPAGCLEHRVPSQRLTLEYFLLRSANEGITEAYTFMRYQKPSVRMLLKQSGRVGAKTLLNRARARVPGLSEAERIGFLVSACRQREQARQLLRLAASPRLREHVMQHNYF